MTRGAEKDLKALTSKIERQVEDKIRSLSEVLRAQDCKLLRGRERAFRVGSGEDRILYHIDDAQLTVTVFRVGHRREVYRNL